MQTLNAFLTITPAILTGIFPLIATYISCSYQLKKDREQQKLLEIYKAKEDLRKRKTELYLEFTKKAQISYKNKEEELNIRRICDSISLICSSDVLERIEIYKNAILGDYSVNCIYDQKELNEYESMDPLDHLKILDLAIKAMRKDLTSIDIEH